MQGRWNELDHTPQSDDKRGYGYENMSDYQQPPRPCTDSEDGADDCPDKKKIEDNMCSDGTGVPTDQCFYRCANSNG